jgi:beta-glucanase (GH16 family)
LPAFWLTQDKGLEIDAMEMLGDDPRKVYCTLHENGQVVFQHTFSGPDFSADYHTFGVDWQAGWVNWFVDGTCVAAWPEPTLDERVWICLDTGMGGPWPGPPDDSALPQSYAIDYVRVWDKMPDPGDPPPPRTSPAVLLGTLPTSSAEFVGTVAPDA